MLRRLLILAAAGTLVAVAAAPSAPAQTDDNGAIAAPTVEVIDPGDEPRAPLRYVLTPATSTTSTQSIDQFIRQVGEDGFGNSNRAPTIDLGLRLDVLDVQPDGTARITFAFTSVEADGNGSAASEAQARAIESALADITEMTGETTITNRGVQLSGSLQIPEGFPDNVKALLEQFENQVASATPALPEEAVGVGARWRATTELTLGGITSQQRYEYTVESIDGGTAELSVKLLQTAKPQDFDPPGAPAGAEYRLLSLRTKGKGSVTLDPTAPIPPSAEIAAKGKQRMRVKERGEDPETLTITIEQEQRLSSP
jgi:hypothetical protein